MKIINNTTDDLAVERIVNVPKRGIGETTIGYAKEYAQEKGMDLYDALVNVEDIPKLSRAVNKVKYFLYHMEIFQEAYENRFP